MFELLPELTAAGFVITNAVALITALLEPNEQGRVLKNRPNSETPVSLFMKRKNVVYTTGQSRFRGSGCISVTVPPTKCFI